VIDFNDRNRDRELKYFGQELMIQSEAKGPLTSRAYTTLVSRLSRMAKGDGIDRILADKQLDALVAPTGGIAWVTNYAGDSFSGSASTPAAVAGYPHITVPAGEVSGLPVGLSFFGSPRTELRLIRYASAFERETQARKPPAYKPTIAKV
jgi:amidase